MSELNPRFACWARAHGCSPETVLDAYPIHEFPIWNRRKLAEFSKVNPGAFTCGGLTDHAAYDAWLPLNLGEPTSKRRA